MDNNSFRSNNFDLIRLLAALQVVLVHGYEHFHLDSLPWLRDVLHAFPGVPIFFVISGFLVSAAWERNPSPIGYGRNRFLRIYPGLWACFLVSLATVGIFYSPQFSVTEFGRWFAAQISFGQFYNPDFLRGYGVGVLNGSLWTIPVELQFYILLPFLMTFLNRLRWNFWLVGGLFVALVVTNQAYLGLVQRGESLPVKLLGVTVAPYLYMFMVGVILQRWRAPLDRYLRGRGALWLVAYVVLCLAVALLGGVYGGNYLNPLLAIVLGATVVACAYSWVGIGERLLRRRDLSYGVYLYHMVWVNVLIEAFAFPAALNMVIMIVLTIGSAWVSWTYVERPALMLKSRRQALAVPHGA